MSSRPFQKALCASLLALVGLLGTSGAIAQICTREYAPVCGQVADEPAPRTFANRCLMDAAKAAFVSQGECAAKPVPILGGDVDAHGCKGSAGFVWNAELQQCVRPWMSNAVTLEVARKRQTCTGVIEMQCLMVRERVRKDKLDNPPADAPDTTYNLLKVLP
jgi:hypothetical protein